jgi:hypothetical protein
MIHIFFEKLKSYFIDVSTVMTESRLLILCIKPEKEIQREREKANERLQSSRENNIPINTPKSSALSLECNSVT